MERLMLFHGSKQIIEVPDPQYANAYNDYGRGFYCTQSLALAQEWACKQNCDGFVNQYYLNTDSLKIFNLLDNNHTILNWIALLLKNRTFRLDNQIAIDARNYMIEHFAPDLTPYDVVIGYRADDSYFSYAEAFVENGLSLGALNQALYLGKLGMQTVLISPKAYEQASFIEAQPVERDVYYPKFIARDIKARQTFQNEIRYHSSYRDDIFILDILREEMRNDDLRIQRIVSQ